MKISTVIKFIFSIIGISIISVVSVLGVLYIDKNNLMEKALENTDSGLHTNLAALNAKLDLFSTSSETNILLIEDKYDIYRKNREYFYINQHQILYADKDYIKYVFNGNYTELKYSIGINKLKSKVDNNLFEKNSKT